MTGVADIRKRKRSASFSETSTTSESGSEGGRLTLSTPLTPSTPRPFYPSEQKSFACPHEDCQKVYNRPARLQDHIRSHTGERPFKCPQDACGKTFRRQSHLSQHVKSSHTSIRDYVCGFEGCVKRFLTATRLKRHKDTHIGRNKYHCAQYPPCNETFRKKTTLQRHIDVQHLQRKPFRCTYSNLESGQECGTGYDTAVKLRAHINRSHGQSKFFCALCGPVYEDGLRLSSSFSSNTELQKHIKTVHPPICDHCGLQYTSPSELSIHIELKHSNKTLEERRTFKCLELGCDKAYTKRSNLNTHQRSAHAFDGLKQFICGVTDLSMSTNVDLAAWHPSDGCQQSFTAKASLESHILRKHLYPSTRRSRRQHKAEVEGPSMLSRLTGSSTKSEEVRQGRDIPCLAGPSCAWRFKREYDLRNHARIEHGMDESTITEAIIEREALNGGCFWIGGPDQSDEDNDDKDYDENEDWEATGVLEEHVWNISESGLLVSLPSDPHLDTHVQHRNGSEVVIDPALVQ